MFAYSVARSAQVSENSYGASRKHWHNARVLAVQTMFKVTSTGSVNISYALSSIEYCEWAGVTGCMCERVLAVVCMWW